MERIEETRRFDAPPEAVWRVYTDHARWREWAGTPGSRLVREGRPDPNGAGAVRAFAGGLREEILEFEPPKRMTYRVVAGPVPFKDHLGEVRLEPDGAGTRLVWSCRLAPRIPGTGGLCRRLVERVFRRALAGLDRELARHR